jgi:hypothetical protein
MDSSSSISSPFPLFVKLITFIRVSVMHKGKEAAHLPLPALPCGETLRLGVKTRYQDGHTLRLAMSA